MGTILVAYATLRRTSRLIHLYLLYDNTMASYNADMRENVGHIWIESIEHMSGHEGKH